MNNSIWRHRLATVAVVLLTCGSASIGLAQQRSQAPSEQPDETHEGERGQLEAEVNQLRAALQEARQALQQARREAEQARREAQRARAEEAGEAQGEETEEQADQEGGSSLNERLSQAARFVNQQRHRLLDKDKKLDRDEKSPRKPAARKSDHRSKKQDGEGERIVSVRLNLDILVVKRSEGKMKAAGKQARDNRKAKAGKWKSGDEAEHSKERQDDDSDDESEDEQENDEGEERGD